MYVDIVISNIFYLNKHFFLFSFFFFLSYSEFVTNMEALTKDMNDYLDRKVYTNYFTDIVPMIWATATNTVLNIIDVDKTARRMHPTKIKTESDQNQQIQSEIYLHRKNNHYSALTAHKENHTSSEWLKGGTRSVVSG